MNSVTKIIDSLKICKLKSILKEPPPGRIITPTRNYNGVSCVSDIEAKNKVLNKMKRHIIFSDSEDIDEEKDNEDNNAEKLLNINIDDISRNVVEDQNKKYDLINININPSPKKKILFSNNLDMDQSNIDKDNVTMIKPMNIKQTDENNTMISTQNTSYMQATTSYQNKEEYLTPTLTRNLKDISPITSKQIEGDVIVATSSQYDGEVKLITSTPIIVISSISKQYLKDYKKTSSLQYKEDVKSTTSTQYGLDVKINISSPNKGDIKTNISSPNKGDIKTNTSSQNQDVIKSISTQNVKDNIVTIPLQYGNNTKEIISLQTEEDFKSITPTQNEGFIKATSFINHQESEIIKNESLKISNQVLDLTCKSSKQIMDQPNLNNSKLSARRSPRKHYYYSVQELESSTIYTDTPNKPSFRVDHSYEIKNTIKTSRNLMNLFENTGDLNDLNNTDSISTSNKSLSKPSNIDKTIDILTLSTIYEKAIDSELKIPSKESEFNKKLETTTCSSSEVDLVNNYCSEVNLISDVDKCNVKLNKFRDITRNEPTSIVLPKNPSPTNQIIQMHSPYLNNSLSQLTDAKDDIFTEDDIMVENVLMNLVDNVVEKTKETNKKVIKKRKEYGKRTPTNITTRARRRSFLLKQRFRKVSDSLTK